MIHSEYKLINELESATRNQLLNYPELSNKNHLKILIKSIIVRRNLKKDKFFWPNGLLSISLEWNHYIKGNNVDIRYLKKYYNKWIKKGVPIKNADYAINGYSLIYLYSITNDKKYLKTIKLIVDYLKSHPKAEDGSLPYRKNSPELIFVDSLGMICPFLCRYGKMSEDDSSIDLAVKQLTNFLKFGMDKTSYLPYHGYDSITRNKLGIIGWGRAVGWLLMGLIDSLEFISKSHPQYNYLCREFRSIVSSVVKYQQEDGNFAWQITAKEGQADTSSTSMITYAIKRGIMLEILPETYLKNVKLSLDALLTNTKNGLVQECSAECKGLGMYPQKYGNYPWAQGPTMSLVSISLDQ